MLKLSHGDLIALGKCLGYESMKGGLCQGFSGMWGQAVLADDEVSFFERLDFISAYKSDFNKLAAHIAQVKEQVKAKQVLDARAQKYLQILSFFDGMQLYLNPQFYSELFPDAFVSQDKLTTIYPVAKSEQLEHVKFTILFDKPYAFNRECLRAFLNDLANLLTEAPSNCPILLGNGCHSVCLKYNKRHNQWHYIDTNDFARYGSPEYVRMLTPTETVESLFQSLRGNSHIVFTTTVLTRPHQGLEALQKRFLNLYHNYPITAEIAGVFNYFGIGLVYLACRGGHLTVLQELLKHPDIAINQADNSGTTPLWIACQNGHLTIMQELVKRSDIAINQADNSRITPLWIACQNSHLPIVRELVKQPDIAINQANNNGVTPLWMACQNGHLTIVQELVNHSDIAINQADNSGATPLWIACQNGHLTIVQYLLKRPDIAINQANNNGAIPLWIACQNSDLTIVQELVNHPGIAINQARSDGVTPLWIACKKGHLTIVQELLKHSDIAFNQANNDGETPLYIACQNGYDTIVDLLLNHETIQVDTIGRQDHTPLQVACLSPDTHNNTHLFQSLVNKNASLTHSNNLGQRALDIAIEQSNRAALTTLLSFVKTHQINPHTVMSKNSLKKAIKWSKENLPEIREYLISRKLKQRAVKSFPSTLFTRVKEKRKKSPHPQSKSICRMM
ncbi:ankyrin repeat-containing protein [Legionella busanensis]|uniref:Ankyrin repeat-containing protein n=1 Tax=Legionella busanensis TaxID=190655 RepID=A0A378KEK7_9GAMM|nr:ankyrin repeat domain-containing protein [Legionella busanensis]STX81682.1 ankyrin repeat-containing protein [Legionella busanensis]